MTDPAALTQQLDRLEEIARADRVDWSDDAQDYTDAVMADQRHRLQPHAADCGWRMGEMNEDCTCGYPARVLALVAGLREVVSEVRELREMTSPGSEMRAANPLVANAVARSTDRALAAVASVFAGEETSHE